jgi:methionyl aminopeptidase
MKAYQIISDILKTLAKQVKPGVKTMAINDKAEKLIAKYGATSMIKGYSHESAKEPWPYVTCININNTIAHGYPNDYILQEGDIVSIDLSIKYDGECADAALSVPVGEVSNARHRLLYYAKQTLYEAIKYMTVGQSTENIARIIESHAISRGYLVNRRFAGHRIGAELHMSPKIYNTTEMSHKYGILEAGQVYCVEPMLTIGNDNFGVTPDINQWCYVTADGKDSAFFEHMVEITPSGPKILTTHINYQKGEL